MELIILLILIIIACSLIRIEHFESDDTDLEQKHQEILDKIKSFNEQSKQFEDETLRLNTNDVPNIQKEIDQNEPSLQPCKAKYLSRVEVIKRDELQKIVNDTANCNKDKIKYIKQQSDYSNKLGKIKFDKMRITTEIESLRATYKSILEDLEKTQKELSDLKTTYNNAQNNLNTLKTKFNNCIKLKASMPMLNRF